MPTLRDPGAAAAQAVAILSRVQRRVTIAHALQASAVFLAIAGVLPAIARGVPLSLGTRVIISAMLGAACASVLTLSRRRDRSAPRAARLIERAYPTLRNLAVTAEELIAAPDRAPAYMRDRVLQDAARAMTGVDAAKAVSLGRDAAAVAIALLMAIVVMPHARVRPGAEAPTVDARAGGRSIAIGDVLIDVMPPAYTGRSATQLRNPASVEAIAGSTASIRVAGVTAPSVRINGSAVADARGDAVRVTLRESGSIAIDAADLHRLVPLIVAPDAAPVVRVTAPGKDLRVADATGTVPIHAAATD